MEPVVTVPVTWGLDADFRSSWYKLLQEQQFIDITIWCRDGMMGAHKTVLSCASDHFKQRLLEAKPQQHTYFMLPDAFAVRHLRHLLDLIYTGETDIPVEDVDLVYELALFIRVNNINLQNFANGSLAAHETSFNIDEKTNSYSTPRKMHLNREPVILNTSLDSFVSAMPSQVESPDMWASAFMSVQRGANMYLETLPDKICINSSFASMQSESVASNQSIESQAAGVLMEMVSGGIATKASDVSPASTDENMESEMKITDKSAGDTSMASEYTGLYMDSGSLSSEGNTTAWVSCSTTNVLNNSQGEIQSESVVQPSVSESENQQDSTEPIAMETSILNVSAAVVYENQSGLNFEHPKENISVTNQVDSATKPATMETEDNNLHNESNIDPISEPVGLETSFSDENVSAVVAQVHTEYILKEHVKSNPVTSSNICVPVVAGKVNLELMEQIVCERAEDESLLEPATVNRVEENGINLDKPVGIKAIAELSNVTNPTEENVTVTEVTSKVAKLSEETETPDKMVDISEPSIVTSPVTANFSIGITGDSGVESMEEPQEDSLDKLADSTNISERDIVTPTALGVTGDSGVDSMEEPQEDTLDKQADSMTEPGIVTPTDAGVTEVKLMEEPQGDTLDKQADCKNIAEPGIVTPTVAGITGDSGVKSMEEPPEEKQADSMNISEPGIEAAPFVESVTASPAKNFKVRSLEQPQQHILGTGSEDSAKAGSIEQLLEKIREEDEAPVKPVRLETTTSDVNVLPIPAEVQVQTCVSAETGTLEAAASNLKFAVIVSAAHPGLELLKQLEKVGQQSDNQSNVESLTTTGQNLPIVATEISTDLKVLAQPEVNNEVNSDVTTVVMDTATADKNATEMDSELESYEQFEENGFAALESDDDTSNEMATDSVDLNASAVSTELNSSVELGENNVHKIHEPTSAETTPCDENEAVAKTSTLFDSNVAAVVAAVHADYLLKRHDEFESDAQESAASDVFCAVDNIVHQFLNEKSPMKEQQQSNPALDKSASFTEYRTPKKQTKSAVKVSTPSDLNVSVVASEPSDVVMTPHDVPQKLTNNECGTVGVATTNTGAGIESTPVVPESPVGKYGSDSDELGRSSRKRTQHTDFSYTPPKQQKISEATGPQNQVLFISPPIVIPDANTPQSPSRIVHPTKLYRAGQSPGKKSDNKSIIHHARKVLQNLHLGNDIGTEQPSKQPKFIGDFGLNMDILGPQNVNSSLITGIEPLTQTPITRKKRVRAASSGRSRSLGGSNKDDTPIHARTKRVTLTPARYNIGFTPIKRRIRNTSTPAKMRASNTPNQDSVHTPIKCNLCTRHYKSPTSVVLHKYIKHNYDSNEFPVQCMVCFRRYLSNKSLRNHTKRSHKPQETQ